MRRRLQYNAQGQLTRVIDEQGRVTDYTYYLPGNPSSGLLESITVDLFDPLAPSLPMARTLQEFLGEAAREGYE